MQIVRLIVRECVGMFVDDEFLALSILAVVAAAASIALGRPAASFWAGLILIAGCVCVLTSSVLKAGGKPKG